MDCRGIYTVAVVGRKNQSRSCTGSMDLLSKLEGRFDEGHRSLGGDILALNASG